MAEGDGRPSYAEVLEFLRRTSPGGHMSEPAPDVSAPGPSLREVSGAFTLAGTDPDVLMAALKGARLPSVPLNQIVTASEAGRSLTARRGSEASPGEAPEAMPPDPPPGDLMAGVGIAGMLKDMTDGGVPPASAERIIGAMLAAHGIMAAGG